MDDCIFCKIVAKDSPAHILWEDEAHIAFLSIFPNTEGMTVVIPKEHKESYAFDLEDEDLSALVVATKKVAKILDEGLEDVGRTAMVFEGFGVDHVHAKLYPMHGTADMKEWKPIELKDPVYFDTYPGYVDSRDGEMRSSEELKEVVQKLKK